MVANRFYSQHVTTVEARLSARDDEIARLRVALGIDPASMGALSALTNTELRAKALSTASRVREFCLSFRDGIGRFDNSKKKEAEQQFNVVKQLSDEFDRALRVDVFSMDNELRRRLSPQAVASIPGIAPSIRFGKDGPPIGMMSLFMSGTGMSAMWTCSLADGIEHMAKILPESSSVK